MGTSRWTPALGTQQLVARLGRDRAFEVLTQLVSRRVLTQAMLRPPYAEVIRCIGQWDAGALLDGDGAEHLSYWPRSWAARALAYVGDDDAGPWLVEAFDDDHWRVRMTAAQSLGRLGAVGYEEELGRLLGDEHPRVRAAAAVALGRTGNEFALVPLRAALDDADATVRRQADRALARVERRIAVGG